jgi:hypothetical protein
MVCEQRRNGYWAAILLGASLAGCASWSRLAPDKDKPMTLMLNAPSDAHWSATTIESAATPEQRRVLKRAKPVTITGEVVDVSCYLQLGKRGEAHIPCGQQCVRNGQPIGLLTDKGQLYLVMPEEHDPRREGEMNIRERFAELMARRVQLSGMMTKQGGYRTLFIRSLPADR